MTTALETDDLPPYLVQWLRHCHPARMRVEEIFALPAPRGEQDHMLVREFGLSFGCVTLVRLIMGTHSGRRRGRITDDKIADVLALWAVEDTVTARAMRMREHSDFPGRGEECVLGYPRSASDTDIMSRIGASVGLSVSSVRTILEDHGKRIPTMKKLFRKVPEGVREELLLLVHSDLTYDEIGERLNICRKTVSKLVKEMGIIRDPPAIGRTDAGENRRRYCLDDTDGAERSAKRSASRSPRNAKRRQSKLH